MSGPRAVGSRPRSSHARPLLAPRLSPRSLTARRTISSCPRCGMKPAASQSRHSRKEAPMTTLFVLIASVLEVGLVVLAAAIFLAMIVAALAVVVWFIGGVSEVTHQPRTPRH